MDSQLFETIWALISAFLSLSRQSDSSFSASVTRTFKSNEHASTSYIGKRFYQLGTGGDTERLRACMGSPVYDEEAEVNHRCLITSNVMCLATTAKCETFAETLLSEDRR